MDAIVTIVAPWKMESTHKHWKRYVGFVVFHLGVFSNIVLSFVIAYAPDLLSVSVRSATFVLLVTSFVAGGLRLYRRASLPEMRVISSPDDYIAMGMVLLFLFTGLLSLLGWEPGIVAYFAIAAVFLVYEPFSKIRHYIYYPFARYFCGAAFGRRGVLGRE
jgi:nitrate reductase gamma subunit